MSNIKITQEEINSILERSEIHAETIFDKVTFVAVKLPNGFVLTESSGAISKENYDFELGKQICLRKIQDKVWQFEGYNLSTRVYFESNEVCD